jgi:NAD dependent epimerase/dehydratase family enzyme
MSWIHLDDIVGAYLTALDNADAQGPINGTAPEPLRNKAFSKCLAAALHRPCLFPIPGFALRLRFGEVAEVITGGQRVLPLRLEQLGYKFQHPTCAAAMADLLPR